MRKQKDMTKKVLDLLNRQSGLISTHKVSLMLGLHWTTALRNLSKLESEGIVEQIQTSNGFFWRLK